MTVSTESQPPTTQGYIVAQPNHSANWQQNKHILITVGVISGLIATAFSVIGAWLILPVAGIEFIALGSALYVVCRQGQQRHIIRFCKDDVIIEKGNQQLTQCWHFKKDHCSLLVHRPAHHWDAIHLEISGYADDGQTLQITVGDFLNKADSQQLLTTLKAQGLPVRSDSIDTLQAM